MVLFISSNLIQHFYFFLLSTVGHINHSRQIVIFISLKIFEMINISRVLSACVWLQLPGRDCKLSLIKLSLHVRTFELVHPLETGCALLLLAWRSQWRLRLQKSLGLGLLKKNTELSSSMGGWGNWFAAQSQGISSQKSPLDILIHTPHFATN